VQLLGMITPVLPLGQLHKVLRVAQALLSNAALLMLMQDQSCTGPGINGPPVLLLANCNDILRFTKLYCMMLIWDLP
jgi:hypothetical protein